MWLLPDGPKWLLRLQPSWLFSSSRKEEKGGERHNPSTRGRFLKVVHTTSTYIPLVAELDVLEGRAENVDIYLSLGKC